MYGSPLLPLVVELLNRPPRATIWPSCTDTDVAIRRVENDGELIPEESGGMTSLTSCDMSSRTAPLLFTRGVIFRMMPMSW